MNKYEPKRSDGRMAYVVSERLMWGETSESIVWDDSLTAAKASHGWTRQLHTRRSVRRATPDDVANLSEHA